MKILKKLTDWYFSRNTLPHWGVLTIDSFIVFIACILGKLFDLSINGLSGSSNTLILGVLVSTIVYVVSFIFFRTYKGIIRYSSFIDLQRISFATIVAAVVCFIIWMLLPSEQYIAMSGPYGVMFTLLATTMLMWMVRVTVKRLYDNFRTDSAIPVAIYGTKAGGISLAKSISSYNKKKYRLRAFISDGQEMKNVTLFGKRIYINHKGIAKEMASIGVQTLLVSPLKSNLFRQNNEMVDEFLSAGIRIMMMPAAEEWDGTSELTHTNLKEVDIEDLLPRDKIEVDMDAIGSLLRDKVILITGAAGSIGSEMVRQVASYNPASLVLIDQAETPMHDIRMMMARQFAHIKSYTIVSSITNKEHMEQIFATHRPDYVFHAAAYKHVPMMEDNPGIAVQNNIYGTRVIADLAVKYEAKKFVMISTDKAVNPTNVMGCSKRICEIYCQSLNKAIVEGKVKGVTQFVTTRFGNVLGSNGSVIPIFKQQLRKGGPITVTHPDIIRFFMLIPEACKLVLEAGTAGKGGEIFVFDMGAPVKILDLAKRMIKLSGAQGIEIKFTGLREGEKLYEEVLNDQEQTKPTHHPKIMIASVREYDYEVAVANEERLLEASYSHDDMAIVKIMKEIVPEYKSKCSKYEVLD